MTMRCQSRDNKVMITRAAMIMKDKSIRKSLPPEVFVHQSMFEKTMVVAGFRT